MKPKISAIIQARISSTRLPRKVLLPIGKKPMLEHVVNQVKHSKLVDEIIIATTKNNDDKKIIDFCKRKNIKYFRGSKDDVLDRYYKCAKKFDCKIIVRVTSDCPLIDPTIIDKVVTKFMGGKYDYVSNNMELHDKEWKNSTCNFPQGMTVEVSTFNALEKAWQEAKKPSEREHVYPFVQFNSELFSINSIIHKNEDLSYIRCTVDRPQDLEFIQKILQKLPQKQIITVPDILKVIKNNPELVKINNEIPFDEGWQKSMMEDKQWKKRLKK